MPSGARKRKAAKKKKILEANNPHEHDDLKSQGDKGSDGSEVSSPAQQDHNNDKHPFSKGDPSGVRSIAQEKSDSVEKENQGENVTEIEWSLKSEKDDEDGSPSSRSSSGNSSRSSSSDDENSGAAAANKATKQGKQDKEASEAVVSVEAEPESYVAGSSSALPIESVLQPSLPISEETINVVESTLVLSSGDDPKGFPVSEAHVAQPSNADSKTLPSQENQASSVGVHPVHKTPWWSCCGMFDVVSGSR